MSTLVKGKDYIGVGVGAMLVNDQGQIFLSKRGPLAQNDRGYWEIPGGGVEFNETLSHAIHREVMEEFGVTIEIIEQLPAFDHILLSDKQHWVSTTFLARVTPGQTPTIREPGKCVEIGWFDWDKLPAPISLVTESDIAEYQRRLRAGGKNEPS